MKVVTVASVMSVQVMNTNTCRRGNFPRLSLLETTDDFLALYGDQGLTQCETIKSYPQGLFFSASTVKTLTVTRESSGDNRSGSNSGAHASVSTDSARKSTLVVSLVGGDPEILLSSLFKILPHFLLLY